MTKKIISAILAIVFIALTFCGCGNNLSDNDIEKIYNDAVKNTFAQDLYFLKETINSTDLVKYTQVNVLASIDKQYNIEKNEDGTYKDLRIEAFEQIDGKETVRNICGPSGENGTDYLFTTENGGENKTKKQISAIDYYNSKEFEKYRIESFIDELKYFTFNDMDFTIEKAEAETKGNVTSLIFAPKKEYVEGYENETGKKSIFSDCERVSIEITYGKISHIITYKNETVEDSSLKVEVENYKLMIVYYGPKIYIPNANDKDWK